MPALIDWAGTHVQVHDDGFMDVAVGTAEPFLRRFRVGFDQGWTYQGQNLLVDEVEQRWTAGSVTAVVRHVFDRSWSVRVQVTRAGVTPDVPSEPTYTSSEPTYTSSEPTYTSSEPTYTSSEPVEDLTVTPPRFEFSSDWPSRRWLAGAEGQLSFDAARPDGALLTFTQLRGRSRLSDGWCWLADLPVRLGVPGTPAGMLALSWRADWLRDEVMQAAALPGWWPETVLDDGDVVLLDLPDAAIEAAGMHVLEDEAGTTLSAQPGIHLAQVHSGHGTTDVEFAVAPSLSSELTARASRILAEDDPRTVSPGKAFLVLRAHGLGVAGDQATSFCRTAAEESTARPGVVAPFTVGLVANLAMGEPSMAAGLPALLERLAEVPGAGLARVQAALAMQLAGEQVRIPAGIQVELGTVDATIHRLEEELIRGGRPDEVTLRRVAGLLGAGLPGRTADPGARARAHAVLGLGLEGLDLGGRWPVPLAQARDLAVKRLLAEPVTDEVIAWLLW